MSQPQLDRRELFNWAKCGIGGAALASLLMEDGRVSAASVPSSADDPPPHLPVKAKRVIQITACGGVSHVDSFDYKPALEKYHGKPLSTLR